MPNPFNQSAHEDNARELLTKTPMKIFKAIPAIMKSVGAIEKGRRNQQQGYAFRGIDDVYAAFQHALVENGVFVVPSVTNISREERQTQKGGTLIYTTLTVEHVFYADDGSSIKAVTVGEAMDSGDKSTNKAMSAAMKYAMLEVFCVPTEGDNDTENASPQPAPKQVAPPVAAKPVTPPTPATAPAKPMAAKPAKAYTAEDRAKFINAVLSNNIKPEELQAFAVQEAYILPNEQADVDWPLHRIPKSKAEFSALLTALTNYKTKNDDIPT